MMISEQKERDHIWLVKHRPLEHNDLKLSISYLEGSLKLSRGISKGVCAF